MEDAETQASRLGSFQQRPDALVNPFESTFQIIAALTNNMTLLKEELSTCHSDLDRRLQKLEHASANPDMRHVHHLEQLDRAVTEFQVTVADRFRALSTSLARTGADKQTQLDKLERELATTAADQTGHLRALDKRMQTETSALRQHLQNAADEWELFRERTRSTLTSHAKVDDDLRRELDKVSCMLMQNSLARESDHLDFKEGLNRPLSARGHGAARASLAAGGLPPLAKDAMALRASSVTPSTRLDASPTPPPGEFFRSESRNS